MAAICVDAGTTMIKAVGYDDAGAEAVVVRRTTTVNRPRPGWAEQDMVSVRDAVTECVREVAGRLAGDVAFLAITAQGDGAWLVDAAGEPTGPAILWNDGRAAAQITDWARSGVLDQAFALNGSLTSAGLPNAILAWLQRFDPDRLARSKVSLSCNGWLFATLTGELGSDESDGSAPFMDIRTRRYSDRLITLYGLDQARDLLPELRPDHRRAGRLTAAAATSTGLPAGTPVVMAPYDIAATAIGVGAVRTGQACCILGTTISTELVTDQLLLDGRPAGITIALGVPGQYLRAFPTLAGGEVIQWACDLLGLRDPDELGRLAAAGAPGAGGLSFLPYLSPAGERAPFLDPQARGSLLGLSFGHGREQLARAVFEGLSLVILDCLTAAGAAPSQIRVCGGGAASSFWLQLIADVTGVPVLRSGDTEAGARGAHLVGLVATGAAADLAAAAGRYVHSRDTFTPVDVEHRFYTELFADFLDLRASTARAWPRLAEMRRRDAGARSGVSA